MIDDDYIKWHSTKKVVKTLSLPATLQKTIDGPQMFEYHKTEDASAEDKVQYTFKSADTPVKAHEEI